MAGTTTKSRDMSLAGSDVSDALISVNKLVDDMELIRAAVVAIATKLDSDAGVTDTNYAAGATLVAINTAAKLLAPKVGDITGTAFS